MKALMLGLAVCLIVSDTFGQQRLPTTQGVAAEPAPPPSATIMLVPFDPQSTVPALGAPTDDTLAVQEFLQQAWYKLLEKLPPERAASIGGIIQAQPNYNEWLVQCRSDQANPLIDMLKKELASASKLSAEERKAKIADLAKQATDVTREIAVLESLMQRQRVSRETMDEKMKALELERERVNMELYAKQERRKALAAQMSQIQTAVSEKVQQDEVLEQLSKIVDARTAAVKRMEDMVKKQVATNSEVQEAEAKVAEAKARLAERKELLRQSNGSDILARLTADMSGVMVDVAELEARKHYIDSQLPNITTVTEDQLKGILQASQFPAPTNKPPPLREELEKKHEDLLRQCGVLLVKEVKLYSDDSAASQPATGDKPR